jgi:hypothetical protein
MLNTLCGRKAGEQVDDTIIFAVSLRLEVRVEMRLLLVISRLRGLIVARLEGILGQTLGDDCFGDHDGRSVEESGKNLNWYDWKRETEELGSSDLIYLSCCVVQAGRCISVVALLKQPPDRASRRSHPIFPSQSINSAHRGTFCNVAQKRKRDKRSFDDCQIK